MKKLKSIKKFLLSPGVRTNKEKGQGFVEFSLVLVLLLVMLGGVVDMGRMFYFYLMLRDAAQEGVAYGTAFPTHCSQIEDRVYTNLTAGTDVAIEILINDKTCQAASKTVDACSGNEIQVQVTEDNFPVTMPFLGTVLGRQSMQLVTQISGTILRPTCPSS